MRHAEIACPVLVWQPQTGLCSIIRLFLADDRPASSYPDDDNQQVQFERLPEPLRVKSGHGNSHGFITHEFISAIVEDRHPEVNVWESIAYTMPGVIAHKSALAGGACMKIKDYGKAPV